MLSNQHVKSKTGSPRDLLLPSSLISPALILAPFRAWKSFWEAQNDQRQGILITEADSADIPQRLVWQAYYETLSILLQLEATHPPYESKLFSKPKSEQLVELINAQSVYGRFLMREIGFPNANESTPEIENWTDQVIANWKVICGPIWRDEDHVNGGKGTTSRLVLDVR